MRRLKGQSGTAELRFLSGTVLGGESLEKVTELRKAENSGAQQLTT